MSGEADTDNEALAASALQFFREKQWSKTLECLNKLKKEKENDPKILHNIAISEYCATGNSEPQKLLDDLAKVKTVISEKAAAGQSDNAEGQEEPATEDIDNALLRYNQAVILFQTRKYASALEVLTKLYRNIEPIEDYLAVRICFLLLDIYLLLKQPERGFSVVMYLEKLYTNLTKPTEERIPQERFEDEVKGEKEREKEKEKEKGKDKDKDKEKDKDKDMSETLFQKPEPLPPAKYSYDSPTKALSLSALELDFSIHMYKAKLYLHHPSTLNQAKDEIKLAKAAGAKVHPLTAHMCLFLKAHLEYLQQDYKKSIAHMQTCTQKKDTTTTQSHNGCLGCDVAFEGAFGEGAPDTASALSPLFFNNLGCIHYKLKKFSAASFYLNRAIKDSESSVYGHNINTNNNNGTSDEHNKRASADQYARDRRVEMLYNLGLQLLLTGKPDLAFQSFQEVALMHYKLPSVWLRLAESCVASHVLKLREEAKVNQKSPLVWKVQGQGNQRRILLPTTGGPHRGLQIKDSETPVSGEEPEESPSTSATRMGTMSLEYAAKCLRNCLFLLHRIATAPPSPPSASPLAPRSGPALGNDSLRPTSPTSPVASSTSSPSTSPPPPPSNLNPSNNNSIPSTLPTSTNGTHGPNQELYNETRQAALVNMAFVSLALANPIVALNSALDLLALPVQIDIYKYLAHVYAAEALCMLGRPTEALDHLSPTIIDELIPPTSPSLPLQGTHPSPYSSLTSHSQPFPNVARNMLYTNLAAAHILRDDLAQAQTCISQALTHQPSSSKALLLQVYLELRKGSNDVALELLKRGRPFPKRKAKR